MKRTDFNTPLHVAAARSLRRAAKAARERAAQTGVPLVLWKNGRVTHVPVSPMKPRKRSVAV
jgi:hypothetical protein